MSVRFDADGPEIEASAASGFSVALPVFTGPFDALLSMIAERRVALTEVALAQITDEFLSYVHHLDTGDEANMDAVSAFLDVAAILVEAKSAALLPGDEQGERDEQSMEALRERDLLFARLVQYRAFKEASDTLRARFESYSGSFPHPSSLQDDVLQRMLRDGGVGRPELVWTMSPRDLAALAASVFANAPADRLAVGQLHVPVVDFRGQARIVAQRLSGLNAGESTTFAVLIEDAHGSVEIASRFLAVLVLFKRGAIQFRQTGPFEPLHLRWVTGVDRTEIMDEGEFA